MLNRRAFLVTPLAASLAGLVKAAPERSLRSHIRRNPLAITMWDFSWLERRWPGAGYEDWDAALDGLKGRGYDAVRIDAYPHLIHYGADKVWELLPVWNVQDWGAPARCRVQVQPNLNRFISKCAERGMCVGLSTWFRQDLDDQRMKIKNPADLAEVWKSTLDSIAAEGLISNLLYVDLCNEFPLDIWAPFTPKGLVRQSPEGVRWMADSIAPLRKAYPTLDYTFSFTSEYDTWRQQDVSMLDFLELHLWMTHYSDFYEQVGYHYERFSTKGYENLQLNAERLYRSKPNYWKSRLTYGIDQLAAWSKFAHKPLITTECWSLVDYKDYPMLHWDWLKELCEVGVKHAAEQGRWAAMATSNFCGPQFVGMWRDVDWHQRLTEVIHNARLRW
jgi:Sugar-binding cellulase-like